MEKTIELPDELLHRAEVEAIRRGVGLTDLLQEGLQRVLDEPMEAATPAEPPQGPTLYELMRDKLGIVDSGVDDLASNPAHLEGLGRDSMGDR